MNEHIDAELIYDLAKLVQKHGPEAFEKLGSLLANSAFSLELSRVLREAGTIDSDPNGARKKHSSITKARNRISEITASDPERGTILTHLHELIAINKTVPTESLRDYANRSGMPRFSTSDRQRIAGRMLSLFADLPLDQLQKHADNLKRLSEESHGDRSLQGWANIIFDGNRKKTG